MGLHANAGCLERELDWFNRVLQARLALHFGQPSEVSDIRLLAPPPLDEDASEYARAVREAGFGFDERLVLMLALVPHVRPQLLDLLFVRNSNLDRGFTEFGGWKGQIHGGFLPTCETAAFLLAGEDLARRFTAMKLFDEDHPFHERGLLRVEHNSGEPYFSAALRLAPEALHRFTTAEVHRPDYGTQFPARRITTPLDWSDLVLPPEVHDEIDAILTWVRHSGTILHDWGLAKSIKPGYRSLFHGPPGTGKTLTATLIGKEVGADVYRIDLSMVVSKYIGETEKNLAHVFDQARSRNWILFFDEADALFGKRTETASSNDRYANQEVAYLLQRVEDFPGMVILATNLKANIDEAFSRRFQSLVYFPMPDAEQRQRLWEGALGSRCPLDAGVDLDQLAREHELSGGAIANVVRHAAIRALRAERPAIGHADLVRGIRQERIKDGWTA
jgi:hypothetical protein